MKIEKLGIFEQALEKKKLQEMLRREHRQKQALQDIKDIFLDAFSLPPLEEAKPLLKQLTYIVEKVNNEDMDTNAKLFEWSEKKFQSKVNEKIYGEIALTQATLATKIEDVKKVLENIFSLYTKLCDPTLSIQESRHHILSLERNLNISGHQLPQKLA